MSQSFPDDPKVGSVQRDAAWVENATPTQIHDALHAGELKDVMASGYFGQKQVAERARAAAAKQQ